VSRATRGADSVAAIAIDLERIDDHGRAEFEILDGVRWRWLDEAA
jgi:Fe-S-cluster formation regulator IscX/YfhJ